MSDKSPSATTPETVMITQAASINAFNRGPITKYWAPPTSCASTMSYDGNLYYGYGALGLLDTACYPMGTKKSADVVDATAWKLYYYSPAVCPGGWDIVTKFTSGVPAEDLVTSISLGSDTSAALCCPGGYKYLTNGHVCTSLLSSGQSVDYIVPSTDIDGNLHLPEPTPSVLPAPSWAFANGVVVMWQSSDLPVLRAATPTSSSASASASKSGDATTNTNSASLPSNTSTQPTGATSPESTTSPISAPVSGGLTTGAKVGLGIGIPLALFIGLAIGWFLFRKRRPYGSAGSPPDYNESGLTKYAHTAVTPVHELHAEPPELGSAENDNGKGYYNRHQLQ